MRATMLLVALPALAMMVSGVLAAPAPMSFDDYDDDYKAGGYKLAKRSPQPFDDYDDHGYDHDGGAFKLAKRSPEPVAHNGEHHHMEELDDGFQRLVKRSPAITEEIDDGTPDVASMSDSEFKESQRVSETATKRAGKAGVARAKTDREVARIRAKAERKAAAVQRTGDKKEESILINGNGAGTSTSAALAEGKPVKALQAFRNKRKKEGHKKTEAATARATRQDSEDINDVA